MTDLGIGIIGTGVMGTDHAARLAGRIAGARLVAVQDADRTRAEAVGKALGARVLGDALALIDDPEIDAILVCSPDASHASLGLAAIAAGKAVLIEKPLAASLAEGERLVQAELRHGRRLVQVGFMRRFDPGYTEMRRSLVSGALGAPLFLHCRHRNATAPDYITSELVIASSAGHEFDAARFLLGEEIASAMVISPPPSRHAPTRQPQLIVLQAESGVAIDIEVFNDASYGYDVRAELVCEDATIALHPAPPTTLRQAGRDGPAVPQDWRQRFDDAYRLQLENWIAALRRGTPASGASAWDGLAAPRVTEACLAAWLSGTQVLVDIPERPALYEPG